ncbi:MAG TPA: GntR family transcriptional regulator [Vicinamibacteria bacterium]
MDIVLNRRGGVPVRDQLVAQLELKILGGSFVPGERLPSVRALARRLDVHANTVSAAYRDLESAGHVELRRGAGVFVRRGAPTALPEARGLDEMIRLALSAAFRKGHSGVEIKAAVERWLKAAPPERVVVVDPSPEMAELVAHEVRSVLPIPVAGCGLLDLAREPGLLSGALALTLPYHASAVTRHVAGAAVDVIHLEFPQKDREAVLDLPPGSTILVVSHSPTVLPFASVLLRTLRGDEVLVEARLARNPKEWRRLVPAADLVFADALAVEAVKKARPRRLREFRVLTQPALGRLRGVLSVVVPRGDGRG